MAITQAVCNSFKRDVLQEGHQIKTDTLKIALFTSAASLSTGGTNWRLGSFRMDVTQDGKR